MGKPSPSVDLNVIDSDGNVVAHDIEGDIAICVKPNRHVDLFKEYWHATDISGLWENQMMLFKVPITETNFLKLKVS